MFTTRKLHNLLFVFLEQKAFHEKGQIVREQLTEKEVGI